MRTLPPKAWLTVGLLWGVALLNYLDRLMITSMRGPIKDAIPMSDAQFGLLSAVFLWVYAFTSPFGGYLADRFGKRRVILASLVIWSAVTCWTGCAGSFNELLLSRALMGVSEACYIPAALALICDYHRGPSRSLATGIHMSGLYAGAALGGVGGWASELWGWRAGFVGFGAVGICYAFVLLRWLQEAHSPQPVEKTAAGGAGERVSLTKGVAAVLGVRGFRVLLLVNVFWGAASWVVSAWLPTYLQDHFHLSLGSAGISASAFPQSAAFIGVLLGGFLADRWSVKEPRARAFLPAAAFFIAAPCLALAASTTILPLALAGLVVFGLARGSFDSNHMPIVRQLVEQRLSATAYGLLNLISCAAGGFMIYAGGLLKDAQIDLGLIFKVVALGLLALGALLLSVFAFPSRKTPAPAPFPGTNL